MTSKLTCNRCGKPSLFDICVKCVIEINREETSLHDFEYDNR